MQPTLRSFDLAHLAHVELLTPKPEQSLDFFVNVMGLTESGRQGDSVYLRGWDDYEHHTLKLTAAKFAAMGHFAFRATSPEALQRRVAVIEKAGLGKGWTTATWAMAGVCVHHVGRAPHGAVLRNRVVQSASGAQAGAEKPGDAVSVAWRQRAPARSSQPARVRCQGPAPVLRGRARHADDRDDRPRQWRRSRRLGDGDQQDATTSRSRRPLRRARPIPSRHVRAR